MRRWLNAHVEAAAWLARQRLPEGGHQPYAIVTDEVLAAYPDLAGGGTGALPEVPTWTGLALGPVDWEDLLHRPELRAHHPGWRQVGAAALLRAAAGGRLAAVLTGAAPAGSGPTGLGPALAWLGLAEGWFVPAGPDRVTASTELRALAGAGRLADPAQWFRRRCQFELDWFWHPVGGLGQALWDGRRPAEFAIPAGAAGFRAAAAELNLPADRLREPAARSLATRLRTAEQPLRVLEPGSGTGLWGRCLADHPRSTVTSVDHSAVLAVAARAVDRGEDSGRHEWWPGDPTGPMPDGPFDLVVAPDILHTVPVAGVERWLAGLADRLVPGGRLVIVDPLLDPARRRPPHHLLVQVKLAVSGGGRVWDLRSLGEAVTAAGLRPERAWQLAGLQVFLARRG